MQQYSKFKVHASSTYDHDPLSFEKFIYIHDLNYPLGLESLKPLKLSSQVPGSSKGSGITGLVR